MTHPRFVSPMKVAQRLLAFLELSDLAPDRRRRKGGEKDAAELAFETDLISFVRNESEVAESLTVYVPVADWCGPVANGLWWTLGR